MPDDVRKQLADRALARSFSRRIARLERHLREVETASQAAFRSVEDGALDFYDDDGVLRERIGKQTDGSYGRRTIEGPIPPAPTEPDVQVISDGVVAITWDGRTEEPWPFVEFRMVRVHLGDTETFTPDRDNQVGAIWAARGGTIVAVTESDDDNPVWVKLAAVSTAGHWTESVAVLVDELDEDDLEEEPEELQWEDGDGHTLTAEDIAAGTVTFGLSHDPEVESLLAWWHSGGLAFAGVPQARGVDFTVDFEAATITWPLSGFEQVDDRLRAHYPYLTVGVDIIVPFGATGWAYKQVAPSDSTNYSTSDTSAWSVGRAAFGNSTGGSVPAWVTNWAPDKRLWVRRDFPAATDVQITVPVEDNCVVYLNGTAVGTVPAAGPGQSNVSPAPVIEVDNSVLNPGGINVLAIRCDNDNTGSTDPTYLDVQVRGRLTGT